MLPEPDAVLIHGITPQQTLAAIKRRVGPDRYSILLPGFGTRDPAKLAEFERFCASMRLGAEPPVPHLTVDNRLTATVPLAEQVAALVGTGRA